MAATVQIVEKNTAGGTETQKDGGTIRFKTADNSTVDTVNPIVIPGAGSAWSYEKWVRLNVTVAPSVNINNIRAYTGGSNPWTGVNLWWKNGGNFATPALGTSSSGYTNGFTYTSGSPLTLGTTNVGPYTGTGEKGDHLVMLMEVTSTATSGQLAATTATMSWDEI